MPRISRATRATPMPMFLFAWLLKTGPDFMTGCLSASYPGRFECTLSKCPFRFSFLTEVPQTGHGSASNATLARSRFSGRHHELFGRKRNRPFQLDSGLVGYFLDFRAYCVDVLGVCAGESYSSFRDHSKIPS